MSFDVENENSNRINKTQLETGNWKVACSRTRLNYRKERGFDRQNLASFEFGMMGYLGTFVLDFTYYLKVYWVFFLIEFYWLRRMNHLRVEGGL